MPEPQITATFTSRGGARVRVIPIARGRFERQCLGCLSVHSEVSDREAAIGEAETHARHCSTAASPRR